MGNSTADSIFHYLKDLLYNPDEASLNVEELDEDFRMVGEGLQYFAQCLAQQRELATALSKGNLSVKLPPPDNQLAAPLKALHASLRHLTWTSQQVAKGDYQQRLDFMGEFADAFNTMTVQLDQRQKALEAEVALGRRKTLALEQSVSLLEAVTNELQQWILVLDVESGETLFQNRTALEALGQAPHLDSKLKQMLKPQREGEYDETRQRELEVSDPAETAARYFSVVSYPIHWKEHRAVAHVVSDISDEKRHVQRLENYAYHDNLTGIANRYFGMQTLRTWLEEGRAFSVCFVDLDNLKFVNDNFGHAEGDTYIINAANLLCDCVDGSLVSRLGGDEFMLLAPGMDQGTLEAIMADTRNTMILRGKEEKRPYICSLSYGVVEVRPDSGLSSGELLGLADERMYQFKRQHKMGRGKTFYPAEGKKSG